jgi:alpha-tubulin suppressor-like RCC1 family protein
MVAWVRPMSVFVTLGHCLACGDTDVPVAERELSCPQQDAASTEVVHVSAAASQTCVIRADASVWCWGDNHSGQLGVDGIVNSPRPLHVPGIPCAREVGTATYHTCSVALNGHIRCWGDNSWGLLGTGTRGSVDGPTTVVNIESAQSVVVNNGYSCALMHDGAVRCWGLNTSGHLGNGSIEDSPLPVSVLGVQGALALSCGGSHCCVINPERRVWCWGRGAEGQLGGDLTDSLEPRLVRGVPNAVRLATGPAQSCAITDTGEAWCWGRNDDGQLGDGTTVAHATPGPVSILSVPIHSMVIDYHYSCALLGDETLTCWGRPPPFSSFHLKPEAIEGMTAIVEVSGSLQHICALQREGALYCWGVNTSGQVGNGFQGGAIVSVPTLVAFDDEPPAP